MINRLSVEEHLAAIHVAHAERRREAGPRRDLPPEPLRPGPASEPLGIPGLRRASRRGSGLGWTAVPRV